MQFAGTRSLQNCECGSLYTCLVYLGSSAIDMGNYVDVRTAGPDF